MAKDGNEVIDELATRARAGDREAFSQIVRLMMNKVIALTYRMTGEIESARDLAQDTFLAAYEKLSTFRGEATFTGWLYRIATNKALNHLKSASTRSTALEDAAPQLAAQAASAFPSPEQVTTNRLLIRDILGFMRQLPPQQRLVFELRFYQRMPFAEIARTVNRAEGTVKTHYRQAVAKLRRYAREKGWRS